MAGGGGPQPSSGRRKSLDAEVNLVPFIDLLSMCICFLLMTAVWMEIGTVNVKQFVGTDAPADTPNTYELEVKYVTPQKMELDIKRTGQRAQVFKVEGATNEARLTQIHDVLKNFAASMKIPLTAEQKVDLGKTITTAKVTTKAGVTYGEIVTVMDAVRDMGIVSLGLVPVKE